MKIQRLSIPLTAVLALLLSNMATLSASVSVSGSMIAEHACQAYVSKNKKTNPNHQLLKIGHTYPLFEANTDNNPQWYRIRIGGADPAERWVHKFCGPINLVEDDEPPEPDGTASCPLTNCNQADTEESYLLAVSWQPAFCETSQGQSKPECSITDPNVYQANNFTLHGLWPNKLSQCGKNYAYCGSVCKRPGGSMCNYPEVELSAGVRQNVAGVMPSVDAGSCLQRHEWWKHGTCSGMEADSYYRLATALTRQFNEAGPAALMANNIGGTVQVEEFLRVVDSAFGAQSRNLVGLNCKGGNLTEIQLKLPKDVSATETLAELFQRTDKSGSRPSGNCQGSFKVDRIGQ